MEPSFLLPSTLLLSFFLSFSVFIIIIIMSRRQRGYPWPSLAISPYHSSPPAGLQGYILCPHIVAVCKFVLVVLLLHIHMWGSTGVHRLWARPCFSSIPFFVDVSFYFSPFFHSLFFPSLTFIFLRSVFHLFRYISSIFFPFVSFLPFLSPFLFLFIYFSLSASSSCIQTESLQRGKTPSQRVSWM